MHKLSTCFFNSPVFHRLTRPLLACFWHLHQGSLGFGTQPIDLVASLVSMIGVKPLSANRTGPLSFQENLVPSCERIWRRKSMVIRCSHKGWLGSRKAEDCEKSDFTRAKHAYGVSV